MKQAKRFRYCEHCNKAWEDISPPTEEAYESGLITIKPDSSLLLPKKAREGNSCATFIGGIFCNIECLENFIHEKLIPRVHQKDKQESKKETLRLLLEGANGFYRKYYTNIRDGRGSVYDLKNIVDEFVSKIFKLFEEGKDVTKNRHK